ncbi:MAG TPA: ATP synthase F1 subunit delta [Thermoanaerobaculia bacterium]
MASVGERNQALGRLYGKALLDLAEEQGQGEALLGELAELAEFLDRTTELQDFLGSPLVDEEVRERTIEKLFRGRMSDLLVDFLQVVNRKGRLSALRAIAEAYRREYRELRGLIDARVRTAVPLGEAQRVRLTEAIARFSGRRPDLVETIDPSLIAGMVVEVGGKKIDTSVATHLKEMGAALERRASQEIHRGSVSMES